MRGTGALAISTDLEPAPSPRDIHENTFASLFKPLPFLLVSGGDARLAINPNTKTNVYGCRAEPRPHALAFSSSTATSITERAYRRAQKAREALIQQTLEIDFLDAFDNQIERLRHALRHCLQLDGQGVEIAFSPSGTDTQLHTLFLTRQLLNGPIACVVVGADQTGSGTAYTSRGRHFSNRTSQGKTVEKGLPIARQSDEITSIGISLFTPDGAIRSECEIDDAVIAVVAKQVRMGHKVILQTMDSSKLGWRAPSDACLLEMTARWPQNLQIVVDACQMRIGRPRLHEYLDRGYVILLTGSKFFSGPAFSGASLWPQALSERIAALKEPPGGLAEYATRFDLPLRWMSIRQALPSAPNFGQWLRWEGALEEMRAYYALPDSYRRSALARLADAVRAAIASSRHLELMAERNKIVDTLDEGMPATIFPFFIGQGDRTLELDEMTRIYRALNRDLASALPGMATDDERVLASTQCHIGQPVKLPSGTILRIGIGARTITEAWSKDGSIAETNIRAVIDQIGTVVRKIELIVANNLHLESSK